MISKEHVKHLAELSRLEFSEEEITDLQKSLNEIVGYIDILQDLDLENVEPMMRVDESLRPFKSDMAKQCLAREKVFENAPSVNMDHFSIPKVVK